MIDRQSTAAVQDSQASASLTGAGVPSVSTSILAAARSLVPYLQQGRAMDAMALRACMTESFGKTDAAGGWKWKDAYEASEVAVVLFLQQFWPAMQKKAAADSNSDLRMLSMLRKLSGLEPSHTRRSEDQVRWQQFSTPLPLAYCALKAADIRPADLVLEPSAGTGMLAAMAQGALGHRAAGALVLNELTKTRAELLGTLFPGVAVSRHNAENIRDFLPAVHPTVVMMNPPFTASPAGASIHYGADLKHVLSAFAMLPAGGRLVAVTGRSCIPAGSDWTSAVARIPAGDELRVVFSMGIHGRAYARRGTSFSTRLTVLDRTPGPDVSFDPGACAENADELLDAVMSAVPPRLPVAGRTADLFGAPPSQDHRPGATASKEKSSRRVLSREAAVPSRDWGDVAELEFESNIPDAGPATSGSVEPYEIWTPSTIRVRGARRHPTPLVQSGAMAAVRHPVSVYTPLLPRRVVTEGLLSDAQLESVVLAGEAHARHLDTKYRIGSKWETIHLCDDSGEPVDTIETAEGETLSEPVSLRRGWMLGDGTGCGKGRQVAGIILDHWLRGRRRALWLSQTDKLLEDARRDWMALGGREDDVFSLSRYPMGLPVTAAEGILFTTYATLRSPSRQGKPSRLEQIVAWLAGSLDEADRHAFDGVIVFDESHAMANAAGSKSERGDKAPSQQGRAGLRLQNALPDARVAYVSATGATTLPGLAYAGRLGLWGAGETPFDTRSDFIVAMEAGGVAAMEIVARDLKALGLYQSRALSYDGIEIDILEHPLTAAQREIYDSYANSFKIIHQNIEAALQATGVVDGPETLNRNAKSAALSRFEGAKQRFFGHLLTSMKCPSLLRAIEQDLADGHSVVVQLVSTGESLMERRIAEIPVSEWDDLNVDLTPRETVLEYLEHAFPVQLQEQYTDQEGNLMSRPVYDPDGNPVMCQDALQMRDQLIGRLAALPPVPAALDQIIHHFGHDEVAEVTGRSRRILRLTDPGGNRLALRTRTPSANLTETAAFMDGQKRILVFSQAGGTGRSYHADASCGNTQRRVHYLLEPGWRADQAIQGLGRTHRTHQVSAPLFRPVATDVKGERRFIATIARRLDTLGAITRGQRDSQSAMGNDRSLFRASDNLESAYARAALRTFFLCLWSGNIAGWSVDAFEDATGLKIQHEGSLKEQLPPMSQFLNRLLALPIDEQNVLFGHLEERIEANIDAAVEAGTYELGVETIRAESMTIGQREHLYRHDRTGAVTELVEIVRRDRLQPMSADEALEASGLAVRPGALSVKGSMRLVNRRSGRAAVLMPAPSQIFDDGGVQARVRLLRPISRDTMAKSELEHSNWMPADEDEWRDVWNSEIEGLPSHRDSRLWLTVGLLLPVWHNLPDENMRVRRLSADCGESLIGRILDARQVDNVQRAFGVNGSFSISREETFRNLLNGGSPMRIGGGLRLARRRIMGSDRIEVEGASGHAIDVLRRDGCMIEIISYRARAFVPDAGVLDRVMGRWPIVV